ncbi:hypothetical protein QE391_001639 [Pseudomonas fluorescens]|nr:hypothetical protein [Pseudomonas fluorescens]
MVVDVTNRLQRPPRGEGQQTGDHNADQHVAEGLAEQCFEAFVAVFWFGGVVGGEQGENADDQVQNTARGVSASGEQDKGVLSGHEFASRESM